MSDLNVEELIFRQLKNTLSSEEERELLEWYRESENNRKQYADYCILFKSREIESVKPYFEKNKERAWIHFSNRLRMKRSVGRSVILTVLRYAAVAFVAFSLGGISLWLFQPKYEELEQCVEIPLGSKSRITLPDGTKVWLNSGSRLTYQNGFGKKSRTLTLDGEGCFDVTKNKELPFEVYSGDVKIRVLGTKFNMKSYSEDESTRVTLLEGSLNVSTRTGGAQEGKTIVPNQQVVINKRSRQLVVKDVDAFNYAMWTEAKKEDVVTKSVVHDKKLPDMVVPNTTLRNILFFDEEPLNQIIRDLERAFNVSIELKEENIGKEKFYGDFRNEETVYDILKIITMNSDLKYEVEDNKIIISK